MELGEISSWAHGLGVRLLWACVLLSAVLMGKREKKGTEAYTVLLMKEDRYHGSHNFFPSFPGHDSERIDSLSMHPLCLVLCA